MFVTDSFRPSCGTSPRRRSAPAAARREAISVAPEIVYQAGAFNLNGIVALDERTLVVVADAATASCSGSTSTRGGAPTIQQIDAPTRAGGDGMLLDRGRLVVVQGYPGAAGRSSSSARRRRAARWSPAHRCDAPRPVDRGPRRRALSSWSTRTSRPARRRSRCRASRGRTVTVMTATTTTATTTTETSDRRPTAPRAHAGRRRSAVWSGCRGSSARSAPPA